MEKTEKITKEELLNNLGGLSLSDDELEKVAGGADCSKCNDMSGSAKIHCLDKCYSY